MQSKKLRSKTDPFRRFMSLIVLAALLFSLVPYTSAAPEGKPGDLLYGIPMVSFRNSDSFKNSNPAAATDGDDTTTTDIFDANSPYTFTFDKGVGLRKIRLLVNDHSKLSSYPIRITYKNEYNSETYEYFRVTSNDFTVEFSHQNVTEILIASGLYTSDTSPLHVYSVEAYGFDTTAPTVPSFTGTAAGNGSADLSWSASTDPDDSVKEYRIYKDGTLFANTAGSMTSFTASGLPNGQTYHFRVSAVDTNDNESAQSAAADVSPYDPASLNLSDLTISSGTLNPPFSPSTLNYIVNVQNEVSSVTVTPTSTDSYSTVTVKGVPVPTAGSPSGGIPLSLGANNIDIVVAVKSGATRLYSITVNRALSPNANLSNLGMTDGVISPAFNSGTLDYTSTVAEGQDSIRVTATAADIAAAGITVNGTALGISSWTDPIPLANWANVINVVVTAQDGTTKSYKLTVTRIAPTRLGNLTTSAGALIPTFTPDTAWYSLSVAHDVSSIKLKPTAALSSDMIVIGKRIVASDSESDAIALAVGTTNINVSVSAIDGSTNYRYTVAVFRPSNDANLSSLDISDGALSPQFSPETTAYTTTVENAVSGITVSGNLPGVGASVKLNGAALACQDPNMPAQLVLRRSCSFSGYAPLEVGANTLSLVVTAQDGTTKTYTIAATRLGLPAPEITNVGISSSNADHTKAMNGDTITLTFTASEPVTKLGNFKINGSNPDSFTSVDNVYTATHLVDSGDTVGANATFQINVKNEAGIYSQTVEGTTDGSSVAIIPVPAPTVTGLAYSPASLTMSVGETKSTVVTATYSDLRKVDVTGLAVWSSANPTVATVTYGSVQGVSVGTTVVTATYGGVSVSIPVTVYAVTVPVPPVNTGGGGGGGSITPAPAPTPTPIPVEPPVVQTGCQSVKDKQDRPSFNDKVNQSAVRCIVSKALNAPAVSFSDVPSTSWSAKSIDIASRMGIIAGYGDGSFKPAGYITRAEFAEVLANSLGVVPVGKDNFSDVQGHWAANAIRALKEKGIISGYEDGSFRPDRLISRAEIATMLSQVQLFAATQVTGQFSDVQGHWAETAINQFAQMGVISGMGNGKFSPDDYATREQAVAMILRMLNVNLNLGLSL